MPALRRGKYQRIYVNETSYAFARTLGAEKILVVMNLSKEKQTLQIPVDKLWQDGYEARNFFTYHKTGVRKGYLELKLEAWSGAWLQ